MDETARLVTGLVHAIGCHNCVRDNCIECITNGRYAGWEATEAAAQELLAPLTSTQNTHDELRERELQLLVNKMRAVEPVFINNPDGPYMHSCPFCLARLVGPGCCEMDDIEHELDCPWLIAVGLLL